MVSDSAKDTAKGGMSLPREIQGIMRSMNAFIPNSRATSDRKTTAAKTKSIMDKRILPLALAGLLVGRIKP